MSNLEGMFCWEDDHGCICGNECDPHPHDWKNCAGCETGCSFCSGGLFHCGKCGAFEGATPDHCPGVQMQPDEADAVYRGLRNFRNGQWRDECCQVMRPVYDLTNYMREAGYVQDGLNNAGNPKWVKI